VINMNETIQEIYEDLAIPLDYKSDSLEKLAKVESRYLKDLKLNLSAVLKKSKSLNAKEAYLLGLATAINEKSAVLKDSFEALAKNEGTTDEEIAEIYSCVSLM